MELFWRYFGIAISAQVLFNSVMPLDKTHSFRTPVRAYLINSFFVSGLVTVASLNAQEVFTSPAGYVKLGNTTVGEPAVAANTDVYLTIPLETELEAVGVVASTTATTITVSGNPSWSTNQWAPTAEDGTPYCVTVTSGAENGMRVMVSSNTADTLTIAEVITPGDVTNISAGDSLEIRRCWTLSSFFGASGVPDGTRVLLRERTLEGIDQPANVNFAFFGGNWFNTSAGNTPADFIPLFPGESFAIRSITDISNLVVAGDVSISSLRNELVRDANLPQGEDLHLGTMSPVPVLVSSSNLPVEDGDRIFLFSPDGSGLDRPADMNFAFFGGSWFDTGNGNVNVTDSLTIEPGTGFILRRSALSSPSIEWTQPAPYSSNN